MLFISEKPPINRSRLCDGEYQTLALLPIAAQAMAPLAGTVPQAVALAHAVLDHVFWYCWDNEWPCCGEPDLADACIQRAEVIVELMFEEEVVEQAIAQFVAEHGGQFPAGHCAPTPRRLARAQGGPPRRGAPLRQSAHPMRRAGAVG